MAVKRRWLLGAGGVAVIAGGGALFGSDLFYQIMAEDKAPVFATDGVAIRGYDPVAYFTESAPVEGSTAHESTWQGVTWRFASAENKTQFDSDPERFAPQYGGFCAWAVAEKSTLFSTQPQNWSIVDDKLYLNYNDGVQATWETDPAGFITQGDMNWPQIMAEG